MPARIRVFVTAVCCAASLALSAKTAHAATITFDAVDLTDLVAGEDLWSYAYTVSDEIFLANAGFSILFDSAAFTSVQAISTPSADWDALVLLPAFSGDSFVYDLLALADNASLAGTFVVDVVRAAGVAAPTTQPFTVNQFDETGNFVGILESGSATATPTAGVPEPATLLLTAMGLGLLPSLRRRRVRQPRA